MKVEIHYKKTSRIEIEASIKILSNSWSNNRYVTWVNIETK